ncbi:UDP-N-acetylglucosamine--N-acetylmuramyl-(pentapeptide) pyrophosphoryl-undecaprenol N-acetylglucosamine transferase [Patescibacteria group bacterium]|nr:UDP-N-acetylglucosamine--N-acetylmuramyl-(pentapeptide) pyrophosphoryl-undecaprenol N-acetylglucosamine transferase [Patescibacteria group bacterium]
MVTILFVGGGSIGHIAPSVAVADSLKKLRPDANIHFVCSNRKEDAEFLKTENFDYTQIDAPRLSLTFPWKFFRAYKKASALLKKLNPQVIFSKGGYVSVPVCLAAHNRKIPIILHESDAVSGYANKLVARWAEVVCFGFEKKPKTQNPKPKTLFTGNPIRNEVTQGNKEEGYQITGFTGDKPILIVMGGSQGAQTLNKTVTTNLDELLKLCDIIHLTGGGKLSTENKEGYWAKEFAYEELPHLYAIATLALSRAGAGSIAELAANNIPTILVPLEGAAHNHQLKNAEVISRSEGFTLLRQKELDTKLVDNILHLLIRNALRVTRYVAPDAARQVAKIILERLASSEERH